MQKGMLTSIMIFMRWDSFAYSYTFTFCKDWSDTSKFKKVFNGRTLEQHHHFYECLILKWFMFLFLKSMPAY